MDQLRDGLPEVVRIRNNIRPYTLCIDTNGRIMAVALDGMSTGPVEDYDAIRKIPREEQLALLAEAWRDVMRSIAFMGTAPGVREIQRMCCLATGLHWREPDGRACGSHMNWISAEEAIRYMVGHKDCQKI